MRSFTFKEGKKSYTMTASFQASIKLVEAVGDPLVISRDMAREQMFHNSGLPYKATFQLTARTLADTIYIGLTEGGKEFEESEVEELVFEMGLSKASEIVLRYLTMFVEPKSEELFKNIQKAGAVESSTGPEKT